MAVGRLYPTEALQERWEREGNDQDFVFFDMHSGDYEINADYTTAKANLLARRPNAAIYIQDIGGHKVIRNVSLRPVR